MENILTWFLTMIVLAGVVGLYFLPTFISFGKKNTTWILFLNAMFGWTLIGWLACFIWACVSPKQELQV